MVVKEYLQSNNSKKRMPVKLSERTLEELKKLQEKTGKTYDDIVFESICNSDNHKKKDIILEEYDEFRSRIYRVTTKSQLRCYENLTPIIKLIAEEKIDLADEIIITIMTMIGNAKKGKR